MRDRFPKRQRRTAAAVAGTLAVALAMAWGTGGAFAEEEEDCRSTPRSCGSSSRISACRRDGESIEYRERAPLVVPPSRNLPPPQSEAAVTANPAWPNDPDVKQRKVEAAQQKKQPDRTAAEAMEAEGRPVSRTELDRGKVAAGNPDQRLPDPGRGRASDAAGRARLQEHFQRHVLVFRGRQGQRPQPSPASRCGRA